MGGNWDRMAQKAGSRAHANNSYSPYLSTIPIDIVNLLQYGELQTGVLVGIWGVEGWGWVLFMI